MIDDHGVHGRVRLTGVTEEVSLGNKEKGRERSCAASTPFFVERSIRCVWRFGAGFLRISKRYRGSVARNREKSPADGADETSLLVNDVDRLPRESEAARQLGLSVSGRRNAPHLSVFP